MPIKTNDIKKGQRIRMDNGWTGTMMDNNKGNTRCCEIEGFVKEVGSVYAHNIAYVQDPITGVWETVEHTKSQRALQSRLAAMGWL